MLMTRIRHLVIIAVAGYAAWGCWPADGVAAPGLRCGGHKVTLSFLDVGAGGTIRGTPGRDVIQGGPDREVILGLGGADVICGGGEQDRIDGGPDRDELRGEEGADTFGDFGPGAALLAGDVLVGGQLDDEADFSKAVASVRANLSTGQMQAGASQGRGGRLSSIEVLRGSRFDDVLVGSDRELFMTGGPGNDLLEGRGGESENSPGESGLFGDEGFDTVSFGWAEEKTTIDLEKSRADIGAGRRGEREAIFRFERVIGSPQTDRITGSDDADVVFAGDGNDLVKGLGGNDEIDGGAGSDTLHPGNGTDIVRGGANDPVAGPKEPGDVLSYAFDKVTDPDPDDFARGMSVDLTTDMFGDPPHASGPPPEDCGPGGVCSDFPDAYGHPGYDYLSGIESVRGPIKGQDTFFDVRGDAGPNVLIGGSKSDIIEGGAGDDFLYGLGGFDLIKGEDGNDYLESGVLDGGPGFDTCKDDQGGDGPGNCEKVSGGGGED
jgi:Ca2+-binding RTX toxin-like protein